MNPIGFVGDEADGLWCGLWNALNEGKPLLDQEATCHRHYDTRVETKADKLPQSHSDWFRTNCKTLKITSDPKEYQTTLSNMLEISKNNPEWKLDPWLTFWNDRRAHWASAFKPSGSPDYNNQAEGYNSHISSFFSKNNNVSIVWDVVNVVEPI